MKRSSPVLEHGMHFRQLLAQVRATVLEAGCADRLDAEAWLANWLCTPNPALGGALPRDLFEPAEDIGPLPADISAELMGRPEKALLKAPSKHW